MGQSNQFHCEAIGNWHNESTLYNEYMLIKMEKKENMKGRIMKRKVSLQHLQEVPMEPL
jgi:hypothetical protein